MWILIGKTLYTDVTTRGRKSGTSAAFTPAACVGFKNRFMWFYKITTNRCCPHRAGGWGVFFFGVSIVY